ncbi:MAG: nitrilase [Deltaproteobacteria bacterium]|nr:nitrilase [Deltaproteobacteria bacterium]
MSPNSAALSPNQTALSKVLTTPLVNTLGVPPWAWLALGALLTVLTGMRWNVAPLAWLAPVPYLIYLHQTHGRRSRWLFLGVLLLAVNLQVLKMITDPLPIFVAPMFGLPIALILFAVFMLWQAIRIRLGETWGLYAFPVLTALLELLTYRFSEGGTWGTYAVTQVENLPLLQLASLFGVSAIGFVMAWVGSFVMVALTSPNPGRLARHGLALGLVLALVFTFGAIRGFTPQGKTVLTAGVVSDLILTPDRFQASKEVKIATETLFARTVAAARQGARIVAWNEAATVVAPAEESAFLQRGAALARQEGIDLMLAYAVPLSSAPFRFENKYVWFSEKGEVVETYFKHHPVPGSEPAEPGRAPLAAFDRPYGRTAGAICYDYDFPAMALGHAALGAGLVMVPSSDWKGIDPYHSQIARIRAIEGGFSVVRPVRASTSMAFDAYGRTREALPFFEQNDRVMLARVPVEPVRTLYARMGDSIGWAYGLFLLAVGWTLWKRKGKPA